MGDNKKQQPIIDTLNYDQCNTDNYDDLPVYYSETFYAKCFRCIPISFKNYFFMHHAIHRQLNARTHSLATI